MADPLGFLKYERVNNPYRPVEERVKDWHELQVPLPVDERKEQAGRCMGCGVPFCHTGVNFGGGRAVTGCPNDNLIPEWNDLIHRGEFKKAWDRLSTTNPLPEMTGRVCPAPCEASCTEALNGSGVAIHDNERFIIDYAYEQDWVVETGLPTVPATGFKIAVVGSGPAGLSAAWRLNQLGHQVKVFERADRLGGLLMYGIPNMKLDKDVVERRIQVMREVGIEFQVNTEIGTDITPEELQAQFDRVIICTGATVPRDMKIEGRELKGIQFAMDFLTDATKEMFAIGKDQTSERLKGKKVVVIGGGDTGADCVATALRLGCESIKQLDINTDLPQYRTEANQWPEHPKVKQTSYGKTEAMAVTGQEVSYYGALTQKFVGNQRHALKGLEVIRLDENRQELPGTEELLEADLVLLAMGFSGVESWLLDQFQIEEAYDDYSTNNDRVYLAGDARRGASLVIWAIREGRKAAEACDHRLRQLVS